MPTPVAVQSDAPQRSSEEIEDRKSMLRARLARNQDRRRVAKDLRQNADLKSQAKTFFIAGEQAEQRGQLVRALNHYKLCVEYIPKDQKYIDALDRVEQALREQEATELWTHAENQTKSDDELQKMSAIDSYIKSCQLSSTSRRLIVLTQYAVEYERASDILELVHQGAEQEPLNLDLKWCLVQCYEAERDLSRARHYIDEMISYDPSEPRALRFQKRYR